MSEKRKLLLADDSVTVQKVVNLAFESENIEIVAAHDGDSALERLSEFLPDLIMADVNMPGADGYEICERIKADEATRQIPVILLVGSFEPFSEDKARRVGADGFLKKPFQSINLLINKVHELLERGGGEEEEIQEETDFNEADTQPMPVYQMPASSTEENFQQESEAQESYQIGNELGEAGMDDEMIETRHVGDYAIMDETSRYETHAAPEETEDFQTSESSAEDYTASEPYGYETVEEFPQAESAEASEPPVYEIAEEPEESYQDYSRYSQETEELPAPPTTSTLNFNDAELLEIPPLDIPQETSGAAYSDETEARETSFEGETTREQETPAEETTEHPSYAETAAEETFDEQMESAETFQEEPAQTETAESYYAPEETPEFETEKTETQAYYAAPAEEEETVEEKSQYYPEEQAAQFSAETETAEDIPSEEETRMTIADETQEIVKAADNELIVHYFPPEVIDAIAERVVEKLAEKLRK